MKTLTKPEHAKALAQDLLARIERGEESGTITIGKCTLTLYDYYRASVCIADNAGKLRKSHTGQPRGATIYPSRLERDLKRGVEAYHYYGGVPAAIAGLERTLAQAVSMEAPAVKRAEGALKDLRTYAAKNP